MYLDWAHERSKSRSKARTKALMLMAGVVANAMNEQKARESKPLRGNRSERKRMEQAVETLTMHLMVDTSLPSPFNRAGPGQSLLPSQTSQKNMRWVDKRVVKSRKWTKTTPVLP